MATRGPVDDDEDDDLPAGRRPGSRTGSGRRGLLLAMVGGGAAFLVAAVVLVFVLQKAARDRNTGGGPAGPAAGAPAVARGADLVVNGSFEEGPDPDPGGPGFTVLPAGTTGLAGWTVTRGSVDHIGAYWQHADGRRSLDLNGNEPGAIAQSLRTKPGRKYTVTFRLAGNCFGGDGPTARWVRVSAAGAQTEFQFDTAGRTYEDMGWITRSWEFTAVGAETTLEFSSLSDAPASCGPALDRVTVVEVGG